MHSTRTYNVFSTCRVREGPESRDEVGAQTRRGEASESSLLQNHKSMCGAWEVVSISFLLSSSFPLHTDTHSHTHILSLVCLCLCSCVQTSFTIYPPSPPFPQLAPSSPHRGSQRRPPRWSTDASLGRADQPNQWHQRVLRPPGARVTITCPVPTPARRPAGWAWSGLARGGGN